MAANDSKYEERVWLGEIYPVENQKLPGGHTLSINEMKDLTVHLFEEANHQHLDVFDRLFSDDFVSLGGAGFKDLYGAEAFKQLYIQFLAAIPDLVFRVDQMIAENNICAVRGTLGGHHQGNFMGFAPPTGNLLSWTGTALLRFNRHGKVDLRLQEWDGLAVMQQMGVIPTPPSSYPNLPEPAPPHTTGKGATSPSQNKAAVRRFLDEVWNKGNLAAADELFHPQATCPSFPQLPTGGAGVRQAAQNIRQAMPDYHLEIIDLLADGDRVLARFTQSGTQTGELMGIPASGRQATWGEIAILRFAGGQVVESWYNVDMLSLMQQLGVGGSVSAGA